MRQREPITLFFVRTALYDSVGAFTSDFFYRNCAI
jgi:hypothetical protein